MLINWIKRRAREHTSSRRFGRKSNKEANRWAHANKPPQAVYKVHSVSGHHTRTPQLQRPKAISRLEVESSGERDYRHLSHFEIAGDKRISQRLSVRYRPRMR